MRSLLRGDMLFGPITSKDSKRVAHWTVLFKCQEVPRCDQLLLSIPRLPVEGQLKIRKGGVNCLGLR